MGPNLIRPRSKVCGVVKGGRLRGDAKCIERIRLKDRISARKCDFPSEFEDHMLSAQLSEEYLARLPMKTLKHLTSEDSRPVFRRLQKEK